MNRSASNGAGRFCLICGKSNADLDHIRTRGAGGTDLHNTQPLCRFHHQERHRIGLGTFAFKYQQVRDHLISLGFTVTIENGIKRVRKPCDTIPVDQEVGEGEPQE